MKQNIETDICVCMVHLYLSVKSSYVINTLHKSSRKAAKNRKTRTKRMQHKADKEKLHSVKEERVVFGKSAFVST